MKLKLEAPKERRLEIEVPEGLKIPKGMEQTPAGEVVIRVKNLTNKESKVIQIKHRELRKKMEADEMDAIEFLYKVMQDYCIDFPREFFDVLDLSHSKKITEAVTALMTESDVPSLEKKSE